MKKDFQTQKLYQSLGFMISISLVFYVLLCLFVVYFHRQSSILYGMIETFFLSSKYKLIGKSCVVQKNQINVKILSNNKNCILSIEKYHPKDFQIV